MGLIKAYDEAMVDYSLEMMQCQAECKLRSNMAMADVLDKLSIEARIHKDEHGMGLYKIITRGAPEKGGKEALNKISNDFKKTIYISRKDAYNLMSDPNGSLSEFISRDEMDKLGDVVLSSRKELQKLDWDFILYEDLEPIRNWIKKYGDDKKYHMASTYEYLLRTIYNMDQNVVRIPKAANVVASAFLHKQESYAMYDTNNNEKDHKFFDQFKSIGAVYALVGADEQGYPKHVNRITLATVKVEPLLGKKK